MFRNAASLVLGIVIAVSTVMLIDTVNHMVFPPPPGLDFSDTAAVEPYLATLPAGAYLFILASAVVAAFVGTLAACYIGTIKPLNCAIVVGGFVFAATVANFIWIPHPLWLSIATLVGVVASALLATKLAPQSTQADDQAEQA